MRSRLVLLLLVAAASGAAAGVVGDATGGSARPAAAHAPGTLFTPGPCPIPARFRAAFRKAAGETGQPLAMLVAVGTVESNFRPIARSRAGARGLLQLLPSTAQSLQLDPEEPASNVLAGARYLSQLLDQFKSTDLMLAAYNAGPTAVERFGGPPSAETERYVANVTALWRTLNGCT
jgi:soluble lytic murein transglycosylase-like protein